LQIYENIQKTILPKIHDFILTPTVFLVDLSEKRILNLSDQDAVGVGHFTTSLGLAHIEAEILQ
jgi:hypothetical protein